MADSGSYSDATTKGTTSESQRTEDTTPSSNSMLSPLTNRHLQGGMTEKEIHVPPDEKEVDISSPINRSATTSGTDKQTFSRATDSSKEVMSNNKDHDVDTSKIFVPQPPPISMDPEVAASSDAQAIIDPSTLSLATTTSSNGILAFRLEKKHTFGLLLYQNQQIAIHPLNLSTQKLDPIAFVTSSMSFIEAVLGQPPMFELFVPNTHPPIQAGRWIPLGLEGIIRMRGEFEAIVPNTSPDSPSHTEKWEMKRKGVVWPGRTYDMWKQPASSSSQKPNDTTKRAPDLAWKGSTRTVRDTLKTHNLSGLQPGGEGESTKHGSLKLVDHNNKGDDEVLALWNQWRDNETLGDLLIFESARGRISVAAIVTSVIAVVHAERITGVHWVGGVGK